MAKLRPWSSLPSYENMQISQSVSFYVFFFFLQDGFLLQPFEKEDRAAPDQAEKDDSCNKVDKPEKTPKKMLSRGEECYSTCSGVLVLDLLQIDFFFFPFFVLSW